MVARRHEPEGRVLLRQRSREGGRDDEELLDLVAPEPGFPVRPVRKLDVEHEQDLALSGRLEDLDHRAVESGTRPGVDSAERVAGHVLADAGESRRILGESGECPFGPAPHVAPPEPARRHCPRADEQAVDPLLGPGRGLSREEIADR